MHPTTRVLAFLVLAAWLALGGGASRLIVGCVGLAVASLVLPAPVWCAAWAMVRRLRWFYLSLFVLYGWFTPGLAGGGTGLALLPSARGLMAAGEQVLALSLIVVAVSLLVHVSTRTELLQAIHALVRPLAWLGLSAERLALRLLLVMDGLEEARRRVEAERRQLHPTGRRVRPVAIAAAVSGLLERTIEQAEQRATEVIVFEPAPAPALRDWLVPAGLLTGLTAADVALRWLFPALAG